MSFRNTFITAFIYQASDEVKAANPIVTEIFQKWAAVLYSKVDERGYGFYSGWFKTLSGTMEEAQEDLRQVIPELERATKVEFRLAILLESGPVLIHTIKPRSPLSDKEKTI